uniref:TNFR-Cys domain-containing protein n=1 Tax=Amphiprion percula TaxID=161767 RepID=A0A3P8TWW3_AMPPE
MGSSCPEGQHLDPLLRRCMDCNRKCGKPYLPPRCTSYCESARCKALPGQYYDRLLNKCIKCKEICGQHTPECSQHCQTLSPPVTTKKLLIEVTSHVSISRRPTWLEDSNILLYSLLGVCLVLLLSSLSLALAVFLRGDKAKSSKPRPSEGTRRKPKCVVQQRQEFGLPTSQLGMTSRDYPTSSSCPTNRDPSDDSSPTETCVCIHCFPDLKALGQCNNRPPRAPFTFNQEAALQRAQIQKGGPLWPEESLHIPGQMAQGGPAVG